MNRPIPPLGIGTWNIGGNRFDRDDTMREAGILAIQDALAQGYRLIDTAEAYSGGAAEEIVGAALRDYKREDVFIISKVWKDHLGASGIRRAMEGSLSRLGVDFIDLYLVHWPSEIVPLSETMPAMERLVEEGLARAIGVSNFSAALLQEARAYLRHAPIAGNEIEYSLAVRDAEAEVIPYCREHGIPLIAYRPLARGALAREMNTTLESLGRKYQKTPAQIALNWIISQGITAIPKASSPDHLRENWGALGWSLEAMDREMLGTL